MIVILPFEKDYYKKFDYNVDYVGHPLIEVIENYKLHAASNKQQNENIINIIIKFFYNSLFQG